MFVNLTPDEEKVKDWWKRWKECSEKYPNDSWDGMEPITETGLIGYPGFYQGDHYDLEMFTEFHRLPTYFERYMFFTYSDGISGKNQHGVADNPDQIIEYFRREYDDPDRKFVVLLRVYDAEEADQNEKFYKQGPYIGACSGGTGEFVGLLATQEVKDNGYLLGFHLIPLPDTKQYESEMVDVYNKYVVEREPLPDTCSIKILSDKIDYDRNGDVKILEEGEERMVTTWVLVNTLMKEKKEGRL